MVMCSAYLKCKVSPANDADGELLWPHEIETATRATVAMQAKMFLIYVYNNVATKLRINT